MRFRSGGVSCVYCGGGTASIGATTASLVNSASKHSRQTPLALTGVVHLLYFFPQVLQIATVKQA